MRMPRSSWVKLLPSVVLLVLTACGGGEESPAPRPATFTVSVNVAGLSGNLVLRLNGANSLAVSASGTFTFGNALANGTAYAVTVASQPATQTCTVTAGGTGTVAGANVTNVSVNCATNTFSIGGTLSGLNGTIVLQNNGSNNLTLTANGGFTFSSALAHGAAYNVTVLTQPTGQTCAVTNGAGTVSGIVAGVTVVCATNTYSIGGTLSGLSGTVVLQNNGGNNLALTANGGFTFSSTMVHGAAYSVTVLTQPVGQTCVVTNGAGAASGSVTNVTVTCTTNTYSIGGTLGGLNGTVVLQNNGGNNLALTANGSFTFGAAIAHGAAYSVTVLTQPAGQTCAVSNGAGNATGAVTNVMVVCTTRLYTIGGTVSGLNGTVVLQNNGSNNLPVSSNGGFSFTAPVQHGAAYNVTVLTQPAGQTCAVSNGAGNASADVSNVTIACTNRLYNIAGTLGGLIGTVVLQNNGGNNLTLSANGTFTFTVPVPHGSPYNVTVLAQPNGQTCTVTAGSGTATANVGNVGVSCANVPVASVTMPAPVPAIVPIGTVVTLTATPRDSSGAALPGRTVLWSSSNPAVATVSNGVVTAVGVGNATISASVDGVSASVSLGVALAVATVQFDTPAPNPRSLVGLLHGFNYLNEPHPPTNLVLPLRPSMWRATPIVVPIAFAHSVGARYQLILSDYWGYPINNLPNGRPYERVAEYEAMMRQIARDLRGQVDIWEIWNEPDPTYGPNFWDGTEQQFFDTYLRAYRILRQELGNDALIAGPSLTRFLPGYLKRFADFCVANGCEANVLTWHELDIQRPWSGIADRVREARATFTQDPAYAALRVREIHVNEIVGPLETYEPAASLMHLQQLEAAEVDATARACWQDSSNTSDCFNNSIDGLLTPDTWQPRAVWWAYKLYADGAASRVRTITTADSLLALASTADAGGKSQILLGYSNTSEPALPPDAALIVRFTGLGAVPYLAGATTLVAQVREIPASGEAPFQPSAGFTRNLAVSGDEATLTIERANARSVYVVTLDR